ncbi:disease resistance protein (TIR-NBS-LRR class) [Trifolium pratense]|uniref:Disease resistance protein (TIR-NBS-LRR class) n=1 Tax=Trifolium pratense TaxID=57577 RepID=A0A2K3LIL2_TRIPR|nr:disease resistance protein (TIR-NBS-LRR class) [Trifolium pratense]
MGREIIREKSPKELEERSRLWFREDVLGVLFERTGTKAVEGLTLKLPIDSSKCFSTKAFKKMKRLRLLQLAGRLEMLKILNLSHSHYLTQTPDFSNLPNLEKLILIDCPRLSEVSRCLMIDKLEEDLEQMESLTTLMANNTSITRVPFSIVRSWMSPTNNISSHFRTSTVTSSLVPLDVPHSNSHELSSISMYLPSLRSLWVECSSELQLSHDAAIILDALYATNSKEMEPTSTTSQASNMVTSTSQVSKHSSKSLLIQIGMNGQVTNILKEIILQV